MQKFVEAVGLFSENNTVTKSGPGHGPKTFPNIPKTTQLLKVVLVMSRILYEPIKCVVGYYPAIGGHFSFFRKAQRNLCNTFLDRVKRSAIKAMCFGNRVKRSATCAM